MGTDGHIVEQGGVEEVLAALDEHFFKIWGIYGISGTKRDFPQDYRF